MSGVHCSSAIMHLINYGPRSILENCLKLKTAYKVLMLIRDERELPKLLFISI